MPVLSSPLMRNLLGDVPKVHQRMDLSSKPDPLIRQNVLNAAPERRDELLQKYLCEQTAGALNIPPTQLNPHQPLTRLGIDSLMALTIKNRLETDLAITVSFSQFLQVNSIAELSAILVEQVTSGVESADAQRLPEVVVDDAEQLLEEVDELSEERVDELLRSFRIPE